MGYWADTAFIPGATDSRVNFYVNQDIMSIADRMRDMPRKASGMKHHRKRRDLSQTIDCVLLPSSGGVSKYVGNIITMGSFWIFTWILFAK